MRRQTRVLLLVALIGSCLAPALNGAAPRRLAFMRGADLWLAALDGTGAKRVARGQMPEMSPDGTRLAYNTVQPIGQPAHRQLAIFDVNAGSTAILDKIPSTNVMAPRWSPNGERLLFDYYANNDPLMGVINADGTGFRG